MKNVELQKTFSVLITEKQTELREKLKSLKSESCALSEHTKSTQIYQKNRELKTLRLIESLLKGETTKQDEDFLVSLTTLTSERPQSVKIEVKKGDKILDVLQRYKDVKKLSEKLQKTCNEQKLKLNYSSGLVE